jgi:SAM-dependent methyltransferase
VRIVWADRGPRTLKYHQVLSELLDLAGDERALLTVLLLRGPQAAGELRSRTERLHPFPDRSDVEATLGRMAAAAVPLVRVLPRRAGERDPRWVHLLDDQPAAGSATPTQALPAIDLGTRDERVRSAYDVVAGAYADALADELAGLPFERWLLDRVAALADGAPVVEVGCGPGHVTGYLAERGVAATGVDLAPAMIDQARARYPLASYAVGDQRSLMRPPAADGWGAVLAWYSLVHTTPAEMPEVLASLVRPLRRGGWLLYGGHAGAGVVHRDDWFDEAVDLDFVLQEPTDVAALFERAGLVDVAWYRRGPITERGETTERAYVLGRASG